MIESFDVEYVRPQNAPCEDCECCTAPLCERGRASVMECAGHLDDPGLRTVVEGCPCSAESTPGTLAWRAAMVRATTFATQRPLRQELETLLRRIEDGGDGGDLAVLLPKLAVRRYAAVGPQGRPVLTDFGRAYLRARDGRRREAAVDVLSVDEAARTAQVLVPGFSAHQEVTVPMDQILTQDTGLTAGNALGATLYAEVNTDAVRAEDVVLTRVRVPAPAGAPEAEEAGR